MSADETQLPSLQSVLSKGAWLAHAVYAAITAEIWWHTPGLADVCTNPHLRSGAKTVAIHTLFTTNFGPNPRGDAAWAEEGQSTYFTIFHAITAASFDTTGAS